MKWQNLKSLLNLRFLDEDDIELVSNKTGSLNILIIRNNTNKHTSTNETIIPFVLNNDDNEQQTITILDKQNDVSYTYTEDEISKYFN